MIICEMCGQKAQAQDLLHLVKKKCKMKACCKYTKTHYDMRSSRVSICMVMPSAHVLRMQAIWL